MTVATLYESDFDSVAGTVSLIVTYDDVSLVLQQLHYVNPSAKPATLTLTGPLNDVITCAANTTQTVDLTPFDIVCVTSQVTYHGLPRTVTTLPGGESIGFTYYP